MDILTNNIKVKYQTHDRIYLVIEEDWNNRTGKLNRKFPLSKNTLNDRVDKKTQLNVQFDMSLRLAVHSICATVSKSLIW